MLISLLATQVRRWLCWACVGYAAALPLAHAQAPGNIEETMRQWIEQTLQRNGQASTGVAAALRMEVEVGQLDPRLRLAPCERIEPYLPTGTRLWGRSRLGLRCAVGPSRWNVFLPITIKAYGPAWVLTGPVAMGATLSATDAMPSEVDWAAAADSVLAEPDQWVGKVAARSLGAGQALRQSMLRAPRLFQAGAQVRVVSQGGGFAISGSGQAMTPGGAGDSVRVRMPNGKIITGTVNAEGMVETQF
ncbi:MAG: flagellar basal body P-ring formation chaperone FlgA [Giesbergeria sp.]|uniref:flagellar basal body P-ring formation chaperone FlgA n=1 Tax=Giesbergeria sp. TaxID=2818473 RepID=UPI002615759F|nr:flagellar basal body P-ring formation chaperone FlgA [Giesbergeria sp.]MDD2608305.1 flagellar basal body P-ring formation chaperone FlgA [Giesbergeria sp.]